MKSISILICGIGGQGIIGFSKVITEVLLNNKNIQNIIQNESRGVSQREGMVTSLIRFTLNSDDTANSDEILTPKLRFGIADILIGLEPLETIRNIQFLSPNGIAFVNNHPNVPKNVLLNEDNKYPDISTIFGGQLQTMYPNVKWIIKDYTGISLEKYETTKNSTNLMLLDIKNEFPNLF